jgi:hypothetical protein
MEQPEAGARLPKVRRPRRHKAKIQTTVRVDADVYAEALAAASKQGLRFTDIVEEGLVALLKAPPKSADAIRLRFLCNHLPRYLESQTLSALAFLAFPFPDPIAESIRYGWDRMMMGFRERHPDYQARLDQLGTLPMPHDEPVAVSSPS